MKYLFKGIFVLSMVFLFTACADKSKLIVKSWEMDIAAMKGEDKSEKKDKNDLLGALGNALGGLLSKAINFEFKSDGSFSTTSPFLGGKGEKVGTWKIEGSNLILTPKGSEEGKAIKIFKLTEDQLVIEAGDDGKKLYLKPKNN